MVSTNCLHRTISRVFLRYSWCPATLHHERDVWLTQERFLSSVVSKYNQSSLTAVSDTSSYSNNICGVSFTVRRNFCVNFIERVPFCASGATTPPLAHHDPHANCRLRQILKHFQVSSNSRQYHSLWKILSECIQPSSCTVVEMKWKSSKSKQPRDSDEESDEELDDDDYDAPLNFKRNSIVVSSMRVDSVISSALDISRRRVDELFYASKLRVNGERLLKKSRQLDEGDYVDLITERAPDMEDHFLVKRVKVLNVLDERTAKDKLRVKVKVWKTPFPVLASPEQV